MQSYLHDDFVPFIDGVIVDHADNGHPQVAPDAKADAKAQATEDGDDVAAWEPKAGTVHKGLVFLRHLDRPALFSQLNGLTPSLLPFKDPGERDMGGKNHQELETGTLSVSWPDRKLAWPSLQVYVFFTCLYHPPEAQSGVHSSSVYKNPTR